MNSETPLLVEPAILALLACPLEDERPPLRQEGNFLACTQCGYLFPIRDGFPDLLPESGIAPGAPRP